MRPIIGIGIDCSKKNHKVCISDNFGKQYGKIFTIGNTVEDIEYLIEKILGVEKYIGVDIPALNYQ